MSDKPTDLSRSASQPEALIPSAWGCRRFVAELIQSTMDRPADWRWGEYRATLDGRDFWIANGASSLKPLDSGVPKLRFIERFRLWRALQRMIARRSWAELSA